MSSQVCSLCGVAAASFLCFCKEQLICEGCLADHLLSSPSLAHKPTPIRLPALDSLLPPETHSPDSPLSLEKARDSLRQALDTVLQFRNSAQLDLQNLRQQWTYDVDRVIEELMLTVMQRTQVITDAIKQRIESLEDPKVLQDVRELTSLRLNLQIRSVDLTGAMKKAVELGISQGAGEELEPCLYKFFGGCDKVAVFNPQTESVGISVTAGQAFFHNSSWCISPANQIYITGGSLTGRSRSDCLVYSPVSNLCFEANRMQVARRSHASIYQNRYCYAFGGLVDAEKTSLCERYSENQEAWESLPQMRDRRAYLGCCALKGKIYIAGGAGNAAIEAFNPDTNEFERAFAGQLSLEESCSMLAIDDFILLFHGNFSGQVSRWTPSTGQISTFPLSYGNSWSNCAPLLLHRTVYFLRSDSVYSFQIDSGQAAFVQRLAKVAVHVGALVLN